MRKDRRIWLVPPDIRQAIQKRWRTYSLFAVTKFFFSQHTILNALYGCPCSHDVAARIIKAAGLTDREPLQYEPHL